jgi:hypothetical protein
MEFYARAYIVSGKGGERMKGTSCKKVIFVKYALMTYVNIIANVGRLHAFYRPRKPLGRVEV